LPPTVVLVPAPDCYSEARELAAADLGATPACANSADGDLVVSRTRRETTTCGFATFKRLKGSQPCCRWTMIFGFAFSASSASTDA